MTKQWGVWITHDIDHIRVREHYVRDFFLFRFLAVSFLEVIKGRRSIISYAKLKLGLLNPDSWNNFDELMALEKKFKIPSTWFFAVNRGKSLSYNPDEIKDVVQKLKVGGFSLGLHGQKYQSEKEIRREYDLFREITGENPKGIRMHYLQMDEKSLALLSELYLYDSSYYDEKARLPKKTLELIEIPIHIMDTYLFSPLYRNMSLDEAKAHTLKIMQKVQKNKGVLTIDIHPHHYCDMFPRQKAYIKWLFAHLEKHKVKRYSVMEILRAYDSAKK